MDRSRRTPSGKESIPALYHDCDACGTPLRIDRTPEGGRYTRSTTVSMTDSVTGKSFYADNAASNGCWFCGSPAWRRGGSLGDMRR